MANSNDTTYPGVKFQKDRHGLIAYGYHRKTKTRLKAAIGSPAFEAELATLNRLVEARDNPLHGTLAAVFDAYHQSPEFRNLAMRTRKDYEKIFLFLRPGAERKLVFNFKVRDALEIRNTAEKKHRRHFANYCVVVLRLVLNWAKTYGYVESNPLADLRGLKIKRPRGMPKANRRWASFECDAVLDAATGGVKVAVALAMFAGMREGDALTATRANYDGARITWVQGKTGEPIRLPVAARLKAILDETMRPHEKVIPIGHRDDKCLVLNTSGCPYTFDGFRTMLHRLIRRLETDGAVLPGLTFHGLRHTAASVLAELGASPHEIAALLGHKTLVMATLYSAEANRDRLGEAAIIRLNPGSRTQRQQGDDKC